MIGKKSSWHKIKNVSLKFKYIPLHLLVFLSNIAFVEIMVPNLS